MEQFCESVRELFASVEDEDAGLTFRASYVEYVPRIGVVADVRMYLSDPWQWSNGELWLLRANEKENADARLAELRAKCASLKNPKVRDEVFETSLADFFDVPEAPEFSVSQPMMRRKGKASAMSLASDADRQRRDDVLKESMDRFPAVEAKMREVYGFRLPRHVAVYHAFMRSLSPLEARGLDSLGRSSGGIMVWFQDGGTERKTRDGLDARLDCRFRCDPPELVTLMWGDSDGLHLGLWYDDPAELPTFIAGNWARDSAETGAYDLTALRYLASQIDDRLEYDDDLPRFALGALKAAIKDFEAAEAQALAEDGPIKWADAEHPDLLGSIGCALPPGAGDPRGGWAHSEARVAGYRAKSDDVDTWIAEARQELADGKPAYAMTLGRELHWLDSDAYREVAAELMIAAYEALNRPQMAEIVRVHYAHRDMGSVAVY